MERKHAIQVVGAVLLLSVMITPALATLTLPNKVEGKPFHDVWDALMDLQKQVGALAKKVASLETSSGSAIAGLQTQVTALTVRVKALEDASSGGTGAALGTACTADRDCASGDCIDGVCCNTKCEGNCNSCALSGHAGTCTQVPDGQDPRKACQVSLGGTPACGGACYSGQCAYPDVGTKCGTCAACDGTGRCTATPIDDPACGTVDCGGLDTGCRVYQDLVGNRCEALGACKQNNDPATCTAWTDLHGSGCP